MENDENELKTLHIFSENLENQNSETYPFLLLSKLRHLLISAYSIVQI